jgi:drug/metabolite transporter (DMT)-like permease
MTAAPLALASASLFGLALVLTQFGLRHVTPLSGAAISIPASTLLFVAVAPLVLADTPVVWAAVPIFAAVGLLFPAAVTLLTFEANRLLGPVIAAALGNLAPLFAVGIALLLLGERLSLPQFAGLIVTVAGVIILALRRGGERRDWQYAYLALPLLAAAMRGMAQPTVKLGLEIWPSALAAALVGYLVSSIVLIVAARLRTGQWVADVSAQSRMWFVGVGLCNGLAVLLMYAALARGPVALVSPLVATYPLATILISALVFGKADGAVLLAFGAILTVAGVVLLLAG